MNKNEHTSQNVFSRFKLFDLDFFDFTFMPQILCVEHDYIAHDPKL